MNDKYAGKFHKTMKLDSQIKEEMDNYIKNKTMQKQTKNKGFHERHEPMNGTQYLSICTARERGCPVKA